MRFYNATFFCDPGAGPKCFVDIEDATKGDESQWPITLTINPKGERTSEPSVTFFMTGDGLDAFKQSLEDAIRKAKEAK